MFILEGFGGSLLVVTKLSGVYVSCAVNKSTDAQATKTHYLVKVCKIWLVGSLMRKYPLRLPMIVFAFVYSASFSINYVLYVHSRE